MHIHNQICTHTIRYANTCTQIHTLSDMGTHTVRQRHDLAHTRSNTHIKTNSKLQIYCACSYSYTNTELQKSARGSWVLGVGTKDAESFLLDLSIVQR